MGDVTDDIIEGTLCQGCGEFLTDDPPGHPQYCDSCRDEAEEFDRWGDG